MRGQYCPPKATRPSALSWGSSLHTHVCVWGGSFSVAPASTPTYSLWQVFGLGAFVGSPSLFLLPSLSLFMLPSGGSAPSAAVSKRVWGACSC